MGSESPGLEVPSHVLEYLRDQATLTLATSSSAGVPRATSLAYATDGAVVYVWTRPDTLTARHMDQNPVVAFAIAHDTTELEQTKGIQATADAQVVLNPSEVSRAKELLEKKYPALAGKLASNISFFRLTPTELQFIDNTSGKGGERQGGGVEFHRDVVYSVFRDLPQQQVETVEAQLQTVQFADGDVIVRQGAPADKFFIIVEGEVEVVREDDGTERQLATLGRGQFFGEMAILRDTPRMATVRAKGATTLFAMPKEAFSGLVAGSMGTTQDFDRVIQQRLAEIGAS